MGDFMQMDYVSGTWPGLWSYSDNPGPNLTMHQRRRRQRFEIVETFGDSPRGARSVTVYRDRCRPSGVMVFDRTIYKPGQRPKRIIRFHTPKRFPQWVG